MTKQIAILGSGMAGCGAAYRLSLDHIRPAMFDKNPYPGGATASFRDGFNLIFDSGPHISFTRDERIQNLFSESVNGHYLTHRAKFDNYWKGFRIPHPVQVHLHHLPVELSVRIIKDFIEAQKFDRPILTYEDWLLSSFGKTFTETFATPYSLKYHLTNPTNLTSDWIGPRIHRPTLEEVLRGALGPSETEAHYISTFRYPAKGGYGAYLSKFLPLTDLQLNRTVTGIDPASRRLHFSGGKTASYDGLISSLPIVELVGLLPDVPREVQDASSRLAWSSCALVNVAVDREDLSETFLTYFYDEDVSFSRVSFPHMLSPNNSFPGVGTIQAEVYFSDRNRPEDVDIEKIKTKAVEDLRRTRVLGKAQVLRSAVRVLKYANVTFDHHRAAAVEIVRGYLEELGIACCGRYGEWNGFWSDESFKSGERAAERVI